MGRLPVGIGWLFEQIRAAIVRWLTRWGLLRRSTGQVRPAAIHAPHRRLRRPGQSERRSVTAIYVDVVGRMGRRGFSRRDSETPLEYLGRYRRSEIGAGGDAALTQLTDLYLAERYGERRSTKGILEQARRAAAGALRAFSRSKLASTVKSWVRGIGAKPHGGE